MKKILIFNSPDDDYSFNVANKGHDMACALNDTYLMFRNCYKYGTLDSKELTNEEYDFSEILKTKFFQILKDHNIELDDIS